MRRGPKTKPSAPLPPAGEPQKPQDLTTAESKLWDDLAGHLRVLGIFNAVYAVAVEELIRSLAEERKAEDVIRREGLLALNGSQVVPHPLIRVRDRAAKRVLTLLREFKLTPARSGGIARTAVDAAAEADARMVEATARLMDR